MKWEDEKGDWRITWGCLTGLFGLVGLLVGLALAARETSFSPPILDAIIEIVPGGLIGVALGALVGAAIGLAVAGGNYLALRRMHGRSAPGQVALGATEFYANGEY
ncbi:MAG TPA: hypothetical protein VMY40_08160, partial [Anaerolineae bacterium]|nr:hypothetical protein [Anaerolineae bacterium]